ncbi:leucine-rich repeat and calponin homology domain-containing protein 3 [Platysternon megacephalum]|uniref:Leucine-rich repeat and calponin homology domain-containing protein 3 n=1 Tax=Platysternon megacephalum TaxID=55544 RepID=A0A4D9E5X1_9SAUR|nr:leucine-rich repeat and calponin homology domain-containing protein 3 [Platysternon megacephalum]
MIQREALPRRERSSVSLAHVFFGFSAHQGPGGCQLLTGTTQLAPSVDAKQPSAGNNTELDWTTAPLHSVPGAHAAHMGSTKTGSPRRLRSAPGVPVTVRECGQARFSQAFPRRATASIREEPARHA